MFVLSSVSPRKEMFVSVRGVVVNNPPCCTVINAKCGVMLFEVNQLPSRGTRA